MKFYSEFAKYFDVIFPPTEPQLKFVDENIKNIFDDKVAIFDVGCATGGHALELHNMGYDVTGVDLSEEMVAIAQKKAGDSKGVEFSAGDMRELDDFHSQYDVVLCLGNTLVHLLEEKDIAKTLSEFYNVLGDVGVAIIQIVNYDRILKHKVDGLATIEREQLTFVRKYSFREDGLIDFNTELSVVGGETYTNSIPLRPLLKADLATQLTRAGFKEIDFYGDYQGSKYEEDSAATVVVAKKMPNM